jgi:hypothetical protein
MISEMEEQVLKVCGWVKRFADYTGSGNKAKELLANMLMRLNPNNFHPFPFAAPAGNPFAFFPRRISPQIPPAAA